MLKQAYEINNNGFIKEIYVVNVDENGRIINDDKMHLIAIDPPHGLFKPKWAGAEWIEGATQEEIEELTRVEPSPPTAEERITMLEDTINFLLGL